MPLRPPAVLGLAAALSCKAAYADLPLTVEDLITERGKLRLYLSWA